VWERGVFMSYPEFIGVFAAFFVGFYKYYYTLLNEKSSKNELIQKLNKYRYLEFYQQWLKKTLLNLDNSLGEFSWSPRFITKNILFHHGLSIMYVFFIYYFVWLISGVEVFSTINILESNTNILSRILMFLGFVFMIFVIYFLEKKMKQPATHELYKRILSLVGGTIGIGAIVIIKGEHVSAGHIIILPLILILTTSFVHQNTFTKMITNVGVFGSLSIISFIILGVFGYFNTKIFFNEFSISIYIFLFILPIINSQFDFVSLSISRYFSKKIANDNSVLSILVHLLIDMFFAVILLLILVNFLYYAIEYINGFLDIDVVIPVQDIFTDAMQNPFSLDNIWVTAMLVTTLFPTLVHFLLVIITFVLYVSKVPSWYIFQIEEIKGNREDQKMRLTVFLSLPSTVVSLILSYLFLYLPYTYFIKWIGI